MEERRAPSLATRRLASVRHVLAVVAAAGAVATLAPLAGCGQKGPLYLPESNPAAATPVSRRPSAPDDMMPRGPAVPPPPGPSSPGVPGGVVGAH